MQPVLGLKIGYLPVSKKGEKTELIVASVRVANGSPSKTFLTSQIIRDSILQARLEVGTSFGGIVLEYFPNLKKLNIISYYPIPQNRGTPNPVFVGKGIAERICARVEAEARRVFPKFETVTHVNPSKYRLEQLKNRGFSVWEIYKGIKRSEFTKALRSKTAKDLFTHRKIKGK